MKQTLLFSLFLIFQSGFSQTLLKGKVISDASNLNKTDVINLSTKKNIQTEKDGSFAILAQPNDVLMIYSPEFEIANVVLTEKDFFNTVFEIQLLPKINKLEEVVIKNYPHINAVSLGIVSKNVKTYTPAERKLREASSGIGMKQLINAISGRTASLKKQLKVERKEFLLTKLSNIYEDAFFSENLKIPSDYIKGFKLFVIEDKKLVASLKSKNRTMTAFLLSQLSLKYNDLLRNEGK